jgi:tetratricopeptide (TPR) repeat protein
MIAKDRDDRYADGRELLDALSRVEVGLAGGPAVAGVRPPRRGALSAAETRLMAMVLVGAAPHAEGDPAAWTEGLAGVVERHKGRIDQLFDGSRVVTLTASSVVTDQAIAAARCALALREALPRLPIGVVMAQAGSGSSRQLNDTADRAVEQLSRSARRLASADGSGAIAVDETIAALLEHRFTFTREDDGAYLAGEQEGGPRRLLGKDTTFVGRDWEMSTLLSLFRDCVEDPAARGALVTGPPGIGKSRLREELKNAVVAAYPDTRVLMGRSDWLRTGSPLHLLGGIVRDACGIRAGDSLGGRRERVLAEVRRHVPAARAGQVAEMLGEIAGAPFPDEHSPALRATRADARLMGEHILIAFKAWLAAELSAHPMLLVLEDIHWGDAATVRFVDEALKDLKGTPLMALAVGRPETSEIFPRLWQDRDMQEIRLKPLPRRAAERLIKEALGSAVDPDTTTRILNRADGNAFYLEELIRTVAVLPTEKSQTLPPTVLAMAQARIENLPPEQRRTLRAASVYGDVFWTGAVAALLGASDQTGTWTAELVSQEIVIRRPESRFEGEDELAFRHTLVREGAYSSLPDADRTLGHRLAGDWLEQHGESDAAVLAHHFSLGRQPERAAVHQLAAAERAARALDLGAAITLAEKGLANAASDDARIRGHHLLAEIHAWRFDWPSVRPHAQAVIERAQPGTSSWIAANALKQSCALMLGDQAAMVEAMMALVTAEPAPDAIPALTQALSFCVFVLCLASQFDAAAGVLAKLDGAAAQLPPEDAVAHGMMRLAHVYHDAWVSGDLWSALGHAEAARKAFDSIEDVRHTMYAACFVAFIHVGLGAFADAEREAAALAAETSPMIVLLREGAVFRVLLARGALAEAREMASRALREIEQAPAKDILSQARMKWWLGDVARLSGDFESADREISAALPAFPPEVFERAIVLATLAAARLGLGRAEEALAAAREALGLLNGHGRHGERPGWIRLVYAEALEASGDHAAAVAALSDARDRLLAIAAKIPDEAARRRYLGDHPEHARTLSLAAEWGLARDVR